LPLVSTQRHSGPGFDHGRHRYLLALRRFRLAYSLPSPLSRRPLMSDRGGDTRARWLGPAIAWLSLLVLFVLSFGSAYMPLGTGNVALNLAIAAVMLAILVAFLMDLRNATSLVK